ncbi:MAG: pantoate--beta-alanine ligase [Fibrobacterales bacterium]|nr:pantoate--beta-alanine ligase [Fibrobacterales bacterium]MBP5189007.1 pantoate--beta-alanine ligase [Fibrobacterales bacterium]MBP5350521.1 pantoate--beta-alanine ligase [Fibrobacterales bacterium]
MKRCKTVEALRRELGKLRAGGKTVGLVPTMGALHEGHLTLVREARAKCDVVVVSVFVNPLQFGPNEDFESYPRRVAQDAKLLEACGADLLFVPTTETFYNPDHQTMIVNPAVQGLYCGKYRPGHFSGALTVVAKLFFAAQPEFAFFGKKDWQQAWLIAKMVSDLNWPIRIVKVPTVRGKDGLALSSRNEYLDPKSRAGAPAIRAALVSLKKAQVSGERNVARLAEEAKKTISRAGGRVQYLEIVSQKSLLPLKSVSEPAVVLVAAFFGKTRLIDNIELSAR